MMTPKTIQFVTLLIMLVTFSCTRQESLKILPVKQFDSTDSLKGKDGKMNYHRIEHFIVENYRSNDENNRFVNNYGKMPLDSSLKNLQDFQRVFYKSSDKTNLKALRDNPRDLVRYSQDHDLIFIYYYSKGKFSFTQKWRNGEIIETDSY